MRTPSLPALLAALVGLSALAACGPRETRVDVARALVRRTAPSADTIRVGRADTLALTARLTLARGRASWTLRDPAGAAAWSASATDDTVAAWTTTRPAAGDWRLELRPDSALGTFEVRGRAW